MARDPSVNEDQILAPGSSDAAVTRTISPDQPGQTRKGYAPCAEAALPAGVGPGTLVGRGRFEILRLLGSGGNSRVFAALDHKLGRTVAMKLVLPVAGGRQASMARRLRREARITARLDHSHIVRLFDIGEWRGLPFLVMEYIPGKALSQVLAGRPMGPRRALEILLQLARGLDHAHAVRVIHRDLKPSNVMLLADDRVKILDFGLARLRQPVSRHMDVSGTPGYMAPEQWHGSVQDDRTDIWAAGMITYQMLAGDLPYRALTVNDWRLAVLSQSPVPFERLFSHNADVPRSVVELLGQALQKRPDDRFQTARHLIAAVTVALETVPRRSQDGRGGDGGVPSEGRHVTRLPCRIRFAPGGRLETSSGFSKERP